MTPFFNSGHVETPNRGMAATARFACKIWLCLHNRHPRRATRVSASPYAGKGTETAGTAAGRISVMINHNIRP